MGNDFHLCTKLLNCNFGMLLCGMNALKPNTIHSSMACYVQYFYTVQQNKCLSVNDLQPW